MDSRFAIEKRTRLSPGGKPRRSESSLEAVLRFGRRGGPSRVLSPPYYYVQRYLQTFAGERVGSAPWPEDRGLSERDLTSLEPVTGSWRWWIDGWKPVVGQGR